MNKEESDLGNYFKDSLTFVLGEEKISTINTNETKVNNNLCKNSSSNLTKYFKDSFSISTVGVNCAENNVNFIEPSTSTTCVSKEKYMNLRKNVEIERITEESIRSRDSMDRKIQENEKQVIISDPRNKNFIKNVKSREKYEENVRNLEEHRERKNDCLKVLDGISKTNISDVDKCVNDNLIVSKVSCNHSENNVHLPSTSSTCLAKQKYTTLRHHLEIKKVTAERIKNRESVERLNQKEENKSQTPKNKNLEISPRKVSPLESEHKQQELETDKVHEENFLHSQESPQKDETEAEKSEKNTIKTAVKSYRNHRNSTSKVSKILKRNNLSSQQKRKTTLEPPEELPKAPDENNVENLSSKDPLPVSNHLTLSAPSVVSTQDKCKLASWGLPPLILQKYEERGITQMFPWQVECLSNPKILEENQNLIYSAPTSAGKTLVAEILVIKTVLERQKKVIFILPFVSVVREKMFYFQDLLSDSGIRVEGFMGSCTPPGGFAATQVAIATIEKANSLINRLMEEGGLVTLGAVVIDELHLLGDPHRGYLLELLLTKLKYMILRDNNVKIQLIGMSATLPNLPLLAKWLNAELYKTDYRPVPLNEQCKVGLTIYNNKLEEVRKLNPSPELSMDTDNIIQLCIETIADGHSVLIFCPTKNWCEKLALQITSSIMKLGNGNTSLGQMLRQQLDATKIIETLEQLKRSPVGLDNVLKNTVSFAVAFHHAGLTMDERDIVEGAFRMGSIRVLTATSTLSSGVNLPARRVIIRSPLFYGKVLDTLTYKQMIGRAGRMGKDTAGESILLCKPNEKKAAEKLLTASLEPIVSCLEGSEPLIRALLEAVASEVAFTTTDLELYTKCTLVSFENQDSNEEDTSTKDAVDFLVNNEFLLLQETDNGEKRWVATPLGKACLAASVPPKDGLFLFEELQKARKCFVLDTELHIIYLVTPFSSGNLIGNVDWMIFLEIWRTLSESERRVGQLVGIQESFLISALRGTIKSGKSLNIHKRFYTALALHDLVREVPLPKVCQKYKCCRGVIQSLQQTASTFAGMVTHFCNELGWDCMELLVAQFQARLQFGVCRELLDLLRLPMLNGLRARSLFKEGITSVAELAMANELDVERALYKALPFESGKEQDGEHEIETAERNKMRTVFVTGRDGLTPREAAVMLVQEARILVQNELGIQEVNWNRNEHSKTSTSISQRISQSKLTRSNVSNSILAPVLETSEAKEDPVPRNQLSGITDVVPDNKENSCDNLENLENIQPDTSGLNPPENEVSQVSHLEENSPKSDIQSSNKEKETRNHENLQVSSRQASNKEQINENERNKPTLIDFVTEVEDMAKEFRNSFRTTLQERHSQINSQKSEGCSKADKSKKIVKEDKQAKKKLSNSQKLPTQISKGQEIFGLETQNLLLNDFENTAENNSKEFKILEFSDKKQNVKTPEKCNKKNCSDTESTKKGKEPDNLEDRFSLNISDIESPQSEKECQPHRYSGSLIDVKRCRKVRGNVSKHTNPSNSENAGGGRLSDSLFSPPNPESKEIRREDATETLKKKNHTIEDLRISETEGSNQSDASEGNKIASKESLEIVISGDKELLDSSRRPITRSISERSKKADNLSLKEDERNELSPNLFDDSLNIESQFCDVLEQNIIGSLRISDFEETQFLNPNDPVRSSIKRRSSEMSKEVTESAKNPNCNGQLEVSPPKRMTLLSWEEDSWDKEVRNPRNAPASGINKSSSHNIQNSRELENLENKRENEGNNAELNDFNVKPKDSRKNTDSNTGLVTTPSKKVQPISWTEDSWDEEERRPRVSPVPGTSKTPSKNVKKSTTFKKPSIKKSTPVTWTENSWDRTVRDAKNSEIPETSKTLLRRNVHNSGIISKSNLQNNTQVNNEDPCKDSNFNVPPRTSPQKLTLLNWTEDSWDTEIKNQRNPETQVQDPRNSVAPGNPENQTTNNEFFSSNNSWNDNCKENNKQEPSESLKKVKPDKKNWKSTNNKKLPEKEKNISSPVLRENIDLACIVKKSEVDDLRKKSQKRKLSEKEEERKSPIAIVRTFNNNRRFSANSNKSDSEDVVKSSQNLDFKTQVLSKSRPRKVKKADGKENILKASKEPVPVRSEKTETVETDENMINDDEVFLNSDEDTPIKKNKITTKPLLISAQLFGIKNVKRREILASCSSTNEVNNIEVKKSPITWNKLEIKDVTSDKNVFHLFRQELMEKSHIAIALGCEVHREHINSIGTKIIGKDGKSKSRRSDTFAHAGKRISGVGISWGRNIAYYISLDSEKDSRIPLKDRLNLVLELLSKTSLNARCFATKEIYKSFYQCCGIVPSCRFLDAKTAVWLLNCNVFEMNFDAMVMEHFPQGRYIIKNFDKSYGNIGPGLNIKSVMSAEYRASAEAVLTWHLMEVLLKKLSEQSPKLLYTFKEIETPIISCLTRMELTGMGVDLKTLQELSSAVQSEMMSLQERAFSLAGRTFNFSSSKDVAVILGFYKGKKVSTNKAVLENCDHPIASLIISWRKLSSTYTKMILPLLNVIENNRIHGSCMTHTITGRVSMHEPNLQNVPKDFESEDNSFVISVRSAFVPASGNLLLSADYCQLELRILAHFSKDKVLCNIMHQEGDVFKNIAAKWNNVTEEQVDDNMRQRTKQLCYGMIYGMGTKSLADTLSVTELEAQEFLDTFMGTYPGIREWLKDILNEAHKNGFVTTLMERRRYLPGLASERQSEKSQAERQAINTTIQGSAADIAKKAMISIEDRMRHEFPNASLILTDVQTSKRKLRSNNKEGQIRGGYLILQLHDELLYEVNEQDLEQTAMIIKESMEETSQLSVPLPVKIKVGPTWGELEEYHFGL